MSLHAFKEPISMVSRSRPGGSPPRMRLPQTSRRTLYTSSRVLVALDAQLGLKIEKEVDSVEILGPSLKSEGTTSKVRKSAKPLHPFFLNGADGEFKPVGSRSKTTSSPHDTMMGASAPTVESTHKGINDLFKDAPTTSSNSKLYTQPLPPYSYKDYSPMPTTVYTQHEEEANDLVETLKGPLGFDMEWRVIFRRGAGERKTALIQLSDERTILLMQVSSMTKFPQKVKEILESPKVIKLGVNIHNDGAKLFRDFGIRAHNLVELGALAKHVDPSFAAVHTTRLIVSLAKVVAYYVGKTLKKGTERVGNWEAQLEGNMIDYAANDTHCAVIVYKKLRSIIDKHDITLSPAAYTSNVTGLPTPALSTITNKSTINAFGAPTNDASSEAALVSPVPETSMTSVPSKRPRSQHLRAYRMWRDSKPLGTMCAELTTRGHPLKETTVISYVIGALQSDQRLPFDMRRLKELVQMEASSWRRHRGWITGAEAKGRGS
ncbi:hypothetical protein PILCRDRAFT_810481 [Piloderma croceum F 1598]|uniref:3'-5' exonuclease domain-containing protein n=1 Tax=Piloderma croceum (strain F 1598) TaxID=765440 RepID=A0A0C3GPE7_PILCF|nr:hypothetical protein PILCRDRAFT_810481 [Piloderma croceum F 1598]